MLQPNLQISSGFAENSASTQNISDDDKALCLSTAQYARSLHMPFAALIRGYWLWNRAPDRAQLKPYNDAIVTLKSFLEKVGDQHKLIPWADNLLDSLNTYDRMPNADFKSIYGCLKDHKDFFLYTLATCEELLGHNVNEDVEAASSAENIAQAALSVGSAPSLTSAYQPAANAAFTVGTNNSSPQTRSSTRKTF